jgi:hypothetical protein
MILLFYILFIDPLHGTKFTREAWIEAGQGRSNWEIHEEEIDCLKGAMVGDLKKNYLIKNVTTKKDVKQFLGEPEYLNHIDSGFRYDIGMCTGFKIDYDTLDIFFDKDDKIIDIFVVQH